MVENKLTFFDAIARSSEFNSRDLGIGTFAEKSLHRTLKFYFEPDASKHEIEFCGMVADILNDQGIIEIQTRSLGKIIPKLELFLQESHVTVVYPIIERKYICRINTETGEMTPKRKSSKIGKPSDALAEMASIRSFIPHERLAILLVFVDAVETRMLHGKIKVGRKRTEKLDCKPIALNSVIRLERAEDYYQILPSNLPHEFTAAEFSRITKQNGIDSNASMKLLLQLGILKREKRGGKAYIYSVNNK